jgi:SET domain-containing protein
MPALVKRAPRAWPVLVVRRSSFHGRGVFATRGVSAGTRVLEYTGERISHAEAAARYDDERAPRAHTLLFAVDRSTVIDGGIGDGIGRYVNHSCAPNCEVFVDGGRIFIETVRDVAAGAELTYDYRLRRPRPLPRDWRRRYACHCDAPSCRGTMLVRPPRRPRTPAARVARRAGTC